MTRFARAKGSKASNERLPNEPTPWHVMKQQLHENPSTDNKGKSKSAKKLLEEADAPCQSGSTVKEVSQWAKFENVERKKKDRPKKNLSNTKPKSKDCTDVTNQNAKGTKPVAVSTTVNDVSGPASGPDVKKANNVEVLSKRQKRNLKRKNENLNDAKPHKLRKHNDTSKTNGQPDSCAGENTGGFDRRHTGPFNRQNNRPNNQNYFQNRQTPANKEAIKQKPPKARDDKEHKRRKPDIGPMKITINGMEVEIVKYDGFPVRKEDATRLTELKQKMILKGIPQSDIDTAMKLERRKAEKALARVRKCVCFHCRKAGHNLSDCPDLAAEQSGTGICFKCGSTEHTHFECKVAKPTEFRFATCFICREQGHIAKQCPDNPKGVYPQGGACKICGDVTHLKKDCPDLVKEKEETTMTVDKIADNTLECLEDEKQPKDTIKRTKKNKVVVF